MAVHRIVAVVVGGMVWMQMLAHAQLPCDVPSINQLLVYRIEDPSVYPPLSIYMPYDVLLGYVALDSLRRAPRPQGEQQVLALFQRQQTLTDTARKILRVYYAMADYNPILFQSAIMYMRGSANSPWVISSEIREKTHTDNLERYPSKTATVPGIIYIRLHPPRASHRHN